MCMQRPDYNFWKLEIVEIKSLLRLYFIIPTHVKQYLTMQETTFGLTYILFINKTVLNPMSFFCAPPFSRVLFL